MVNNADAAAVVITTAALPAPLQALLDRRLLIQIPEPVSSPYLCYDGVLQLVQPNTKIKPIAVDFSAGKHRHRRNFGGGRGQLMCKAVGLKTGLKLRVVDMTAGLGGDAFVLATMGCSVHMIERASVAAALLTDALYRLEHAEPELAALLSLTVADSGSVALPRDYDVAYLDPMYPDHKSKAAVNKSMAAFRDLVGKDEDASRLWSVAKVAGVKRIVVKRPKSGALLVDYTPSNQFVGKSSRYDVYAFKKLTANSVVE